MGFKDARALLVEALRSGVYSTEDRGDIEEKNLLHSRKVSPEFVIDLLLRCAGWEYSTSRHHFQDADCHIFTPSLGGERWYIKAYRGPAGVVFISVHP